MDRADVIILGGGLVGLTLAIALDRHGLTSIVIDPADPERQRTLAFDGRTTAVASASYRMLKTIGVADYLHETGCPIEKIRVSDGLAPGGLCFAAPGSDEGSKASDPLGMMFENRILRSALHDCAAESSAIRLCAGERAADVTRDATSVRVTLASGGSVTAPLLIGAEGRNSPTREAAHIPLARWRYDHVAIVTTIAVERPHDNIAYEIFYPSGPFAILPMLGAEGFDHRCAIIWSVKTGDAPAMLDLPDRALAAEIEKKMGGFLGKVVLASPRSAYPLGFHHAASITAKRLALVGDAAHGIHPIAGQGLNLGFRDVAALAQVLVEGARSGMDLGDAQLLAQYERWRSLDSLMVAAATDSLTRLYAIPGRTASLVRRLGMGAVQRIAPLKSWFMAEARGESGDLPLLLRGLTI